ncbi:Uncharacterised protein [Amycolatopsis camponoti]|uniref:Uncharacterized protein n=1 Tax=Amycolatopsis camponoti TaxID=2606593 RepID=A0A6I8LS28_9PSEU|nr:Uncharacterised protein [Amycolatopsis camponoti]
MEGIAEGGIGGLLAGHGLLLASSGVSRQQKNLPHGCERLRAGCSCGATVRRAR